jgi:hypothetical protein
LIFSEKYVSEAGELKALPVDFFPEFGEALGGLGMTDWHRFTLAGYENPPKD